MAVAPNPETVDVLSATGRQQQQHHREFSDIERQHQFSLISPASELTSTQTYVGVGQPSGASVSSAADDSFRITGNGAYSYDCLSVHFHLHVLSSGAVEITSAVFDTRIATDGKIEKLKKIQSRRLAIPAGEISQCNPGNNVIFLSLRTNDNRNYI